MTQEDDKLFAARLNVKCLELEQECKELRAQLDLYLKPRPYTYQEACVALGARPEKARKFSYNHYYPNQGGGGDYEHDDRRVLGVTPEGFLVNGAQGLSEYSDNWTFEWMLNADIKWMDGELAATVPQIQVPKEIVDACSQEVPL